MGQAGDQEKTRKGKSMERFRTMSLLAAIAVVSGCALCPENRLTDLEGFTVGMIADTQYTTPNLKKGYGFRSKLADNFANVSIRPPAVEALALENMRYMLTDLAMQDPDVVLYLGDGANSGCADEIDDFFAALREVRSRTGKPIFFAIGNHDYLATGNQSEPQIREAVCGDKPYVSKMQLVNIVSDFNRESFEDFNRDAMLTSYSDSYIDLGTDGWKECLGRDGGGSAHRSGCFHATRVTFNTREGEHGDLLLLDTSDYRDLVQKPGTGGPIELYGVRGGISFDDDRYPRSQTRWYLDQIREDKKGVDVRILASHYPSADLNWGPAFPSGRAGDLMLESGQNLWLSAHTHTDHPETAYFPIGSFSGANLKEPRYYNEVNVGSTTDYPPHTTLVQSEYGKIRKTDILLAGYRNPESCATVDAAIATFKTPRPAFGKHTGPVALGMTRDYRDWYQDYAETEHARDNVLAFLRDYAGDDTQRRRVAVQCILLAASRNEKGGWSPF